jgi:hypothetical protein
MTVPAHLQTIAVYAAVLDGVWIGFELAALPADKLAACKCFVVSAGHGQLC